MKTVFQIQRIVGLLSIMLMTNSFDMFAQELRASYDISFVSNWSQSTHPHTSGNIPSSAHWSKLVGATHNDQIVFLEMGQVATEGIERVAELGSNGVFFSEVDDAISQGNANQKINGPNLGSALGEMKVNDLMVHKDFPLLTLTSMIAPSPDWMIAINGISLIDTNGDWINEIEMDLYPYDAGTDMGLDYTSPNSDMNPPGVISSLQGIAPFSNEKIGTLIITLRGTSVGVEDALTRNVKIYPNPVLSELNIEPGDLTIHTISIYNLVGKQELLTPYQESIDVSQLVNGVYLVKLIYNDGKELFHKLVKRAE